jgi:hypothetical protein
MVQIVRNGLIVQADQIVPVVLISRSSPINRNDLIVRSDQTDQRLLAMAVVAADDGILHRSQINRSALTAHSALNLRNA